MKFTGKEAAMLAHLLAAALAFLGVVGLPDVPATEKALYGAITAAAGLASYAVLGWKYIRHHRDTEFMEHFVAAARPGPGELRVVRPPEDRPS